MTLQQLEYIVALDNFRHFVSAAAHCNVTQPTLTMQVKKLEEFLGAAIFDRSKHPLEPTPIGLEIIEKARAVLSESEGIVQLVQQQQQDISGTYRLGIIPTLAPYLLPLFLPTFESHHASVRFTIRELQTLELIEALKKDSIDIALVVTPLNESLLEERAVFYEPFMAYLPQNHPLNKKEFITSEMLQEGRFLSLDQGHCFREQALTLCHSSENAHFDYQSGSIEALVQLVDRGLGFTLVPELAINSRWDTSRVKRFAHPEPVREVSIVTRKGYPKQKIIEVLTEVIQSNLPSRIEQKEYYQRIEWR